MYWCIGHDQFEASWSDVDLKINLKLQKKQDGMFVSKKIKFNLRVGNVTQNNKSKILAIVSFDIASLRLASQAGPGELSPSNRAGTYCYIIIYLYASVSHCFTYKLVCTCTFLYSFSVQS